MTSLQLGKMYLIKVSFDIIAVRKNVSNIYSDRSDPLENCPFYFFVILPRLRSTSSVSWINLVQIPSPSFSLHNLSKRGILSLWQLNYKNNKAFFLLKFSITLELSRCYFYENQGGIKDRTGWFLTCLYIEIFPGETGYQEAMGEFVSCFLSIKFHKRFNIFVPASEHCWWSSLPNLIFTSI